MHIQAKLWQRPCGFAVITAWYELRGSGAVPGGPVGSDAAGAVDNGAVLRSCRWRNKPDHRLRKPGRQCEVAGCCFGTGPGSKCCIPRVK